MSLSILITDFLEYLEVERNVSPKTVRNYHHYLARFLGFTGDIEPDQINLDLMRKFRLYLSRYEDPESGLRLKRKTQNYFLISIRSFLRFLARRDIETLSADKIELSEQEASPLKILENNHLEQLLDAPDTSNESGLRDRTILAVLFSTGLRVAELTSLNRDQINLKRREFSIVGKGQKERIVFLSDEAVVWLNRFLANRTDDYKPLFIRYQGRLDADNDGENMRLTPRSVERIVEKYVKQIGLPVKATPHTLRHSFATDLLINGADLRSVQEMLGHSNIATTQIYTHVTNRHLKDVHKAFHSKQNSEKEVSPPPDEIMDL